jgi:UPF0176 protein
MPFLNLSAYKFTPLHELTALQQRLARTATTGGLKGTILLSGEGINLFVAGERAGVASLVAELRSIPGLEDLTPKESTSAAQPFRRMRVKIKKEIIAFGVPGVDPAHRPTRKLPPAALRQWLDEGRTVTLLDTRNHYEVQLGSFRGAKHTAIANFREFPMAARSLPAELKTQPLVMFCTGGIRCEKAGPWLEREGFQNVFQLEGGILNYFEQCGSAHYEGECFVFDERVGLDAALSETGASLCPRCQMPLTKEEQAATRAEAGGAHLCRHRLQRPTAPAPSVTPASRQTESVV